MIRTETVSTDKVRFVDTGVPREKARAPFVHSIEVSDHRSLRHFVTIFSKGYCPEQVKWKNGADAANPHVDFTLHSPEVFHRDNGSISWIWDTYFPKREVPDAERWHQHFHWPLDRAPDAENVGAVLKALGNGVSDEMEDAIVAYLPARNVVPITAAKKVKARKKDAA